MLYRLAGLAWTYQWGFAFGWGNNPGDGRKVRIGIGPNYYVLGGFGATWKESYMAKGRVR